MAETLQIIYKSIICVRVGMKNLYLAITVYHHSASLVMQKGDPRDGFFYPTLMMEFYIPGLSNE